VKTALSLLNEEKLLVYRETFSYDGFTTCVACANLTLAKAWIKQALEYAKLSTGEDGEFYRTKRKYLKNPRAHEAWGLYPHVEDDVLGGPEDDSRII
jgi:hypothetical protein